MNKYREGKVKSTAVSRVKENLKPYAHKQSEGYGRSVSPRKRVMRGKA